MEELNEEEIVQGYKEYLKRMLNGSAPIEQTASFEQYRETELN